MSLPQALQARCCSGALLGARAEPAGARALPVQHRGGAGRQSCDLPPSGRPGSGAKATSPPCEIDKWLVFFFFLPLLVLGRK